MGHRALHNDRDLQAFELLLKGYIRLHWIVIDLFYINFGFFMYNVTLEHTISPLQMLVFLLTKDRVSRLLFDMCDDLWVYFHCSYECV